MREDRPRPIDLAELILLVQEPSTAEGRALKAAIEGRLARMPENSSGRAMFRFVDRLAETNGDPRARRRAGFMMNVFRRDRRRRKRGVSTPPSSGTRTT